jgi:predicted acylesterase/phospholipase RssA
VRALSLPGCACRGAFQFGVMARLSAAGERFDLVAGASSGSICGAVTVAGLAERGPDFARALGATPIVSTRYLGTERSVFGMGHILRETLRVNLPAAILRDAAAELLVATTHAGRYARRFIPARAFRRGGAEEARHDPLVIHSSRGPGHLHEIILASCYIPVLYAGVARLDGALHLDGALSDNTLLDALVARGAADITVVTPFADGAVAQTMFAAEGPLRPRPGVRLRVLYPARPLAIGRFDFSRERIEEALRMPHAERVIESPIANARAPS